MSFLKSADLQLWLFVGLILLPVTAIESVQIGYYSDFPEMDLLGQFLPRICAIPLLIAMGLFAECRGVMVPIGLLLVLGLICASVLIYCVDHLTTAGSVVLGSLLDHVVVPGLAGMLGVYIGFVPRRIASLVGLSTVCKLGWSLIQWTSLTVAITTVKVTLVICLLVVLWVLRSHALTVSAHWTPALHPPVTASLGLSHLLLLALVIIESGILPSYDTLLVSKRVYSLLEAVLALVGLASVAKWWSSKWLPLALVAVTLLGAAFLLSGLVAPGWVFVRLATAGLFASSLIVGVGAFAPNRRAVGTMYLLALHQVFSACMLAGRPEDLEVWCDIWIGVLGLVSLLVWYTIHKSHKIEVELPRVTPRNTQPNTPMRSRPCTPKVTRPNTPLKSRPSTPKITRANTLKPADTPQSVNLPITSPKDSIRFESAVVVAIPSNIPILFDQDYV